MTELTHDQSHRLRSASLFRRLLLRLLSWMLYIVFSLLRKSCSIKEYQLENVELAKSIHPSQSFNLALWHENIFASVSAQVGRGVAPMISESADGELVTFITKKLGFSPVRGSSSSRGQEAKAELQRRVTKGVVTALTVDGPRGPRRKVKPGIAMIANSTNTAILPMACISDRFWTLGSWDRARIPKPFSNIAVFYGDPIRIEEPLRSKSEIRAACTRVEAALNEIDSTASQFHCNSSTP